VAWFGSRFCFSDFLFFWRDLWVILVCAFLLLFRIFRISGFSAFSRISRSGLFSGFLPFSRNSRSGWFLFCLVSRFAGLLKGIAPFVDGQNRTPNATNKSIPHFLL